MVDKVLILGSKPKSKIPKIEVSKIYTANGAAYKVEEYKKYFKDISHTCIIGVDHFLGNNDVKEKVENSEIDELIIRGKRKIKIDSFRSKPSILYLNNLDQLKIQSKVFNNSFFNLIYGETKYEINIISKIIHFMRCVKKRKIQAVSTGFFSIIYASLMNPNSELIISGIGMQEDHDLYNKKEEGFVKRARVDKFLVKKLDKKFKEKIFTTDTLLASYAGFKLWKGSFI